MRRVDVFDVWNEVEVEEEAAKCEDFQLRKLRPSVLGARK